ncbi:MAG: ATP-dependent DNA helicase [Rhodospirillaceae bacterium]|nr:ATP-dependent DNA helicase [Rhodospirillaceae bacterium]
MTPIPPGRILTPTAPSLTVHPKGAFWLSADGEWENLTLAETARRVRATPPLLCHAPAVAARLRLSAFPCLDILELFAFARPACFAVPTVAGVAGALGLDLPASDEDEPEAMLDIVRVLLEGLAGEETRLPRKLLADRQGIAAVMAQGGWAWGPAVRAAYGGVDGRGRAAFRVWERLEEWQDGAPPPPPGDRPVEPSAARARLAQLLGPDAEERPGQSDYASAASLAFIPREMRGAPNLVLAEAGTGIGKTLGYIAPASLWAEANGAPVWISTYTRTLQRQLDGELERLYPDAALRADKVVVRKGRENYLCLLNLDEAASRIASGAPGAVSGGAVLLGLVAAWTLATRDGDMTGGDLPGWLADLLGKGPLLALADRRGECVYSACPHFRTCFVEKTVRRARRADIVVANHALVMMQAAFGGLDDGYLPTRYVFDEGHHLFDAADGAFSAALSGMEATELRRWLLGAESGGRPSRARGLKRRAEDLIADEDGARALDDILAAARALPGPGWRQRLTDSQPGGAAESFLALVREQVRARASGLDGPYSLECDPRPLNPGLAEAAQRLKTAFERLSAPLTLMVRLLEGRLDAEAETLDSAQRIRIEALARGIERRALAPLSAWTAMLGELDAEANADFVDWFFIERSEGHDVDAGFARHWVDPMLPYAQAVAAPAHGLVVTSATLRDGSGDIEADWRSAEQRTGAAYLPRPAVRAALSSPFDYPAQTRVLIVTDVRKDDLAQVAAAYRELFKAAGGGGLGLFTAIARLKAVQARIAGPLDEAGIPLLAQHVGGMDTPTVVDIFRAVENACLLGTDALRDGVDVPGRSLRLIVFDRVPWPRPDILHRARRARFGGRSYDDRIARLRLKQAFGRLVRRSGDSGVFVLLDPMMPSRLFGAFPEGVVPARVGLAEAIAEIRAFLVHPQPDGTA